MDAEHKPLLPKRCRFPGPSPVLGGHSAPGAAVAQPRARGAVSLLQQHRVSAQPRAGSRGALWAVTPPAEAEQAVFCHCDPFSINPSRGSCSASKGKARQGWVPRDAIHYPDRKAGNTINTMDFIISYQSLVDNMGYFRNNFSGIKDNSAGKWT